MVATVEKTTESAKHNGEVSCLFAEEEHVFSGGADGVIKVRYFARGTNSNCRKSLNKIVIETKKERKIFENDFR